MHLKEEIRRESWKRMANIEEIYGDRYLPSHVMSAYRLYHLFYEASIQKYFASYGYLPINVSEVGDAKAEFKWGDVTDFERDAINFLNEYCRRMETSSSRTALQVVG